MGIDRNEFFSQIFGDMNRYFDTYVYICSFCYGIPVWIMTTQ